MVKAGLLEAQSWRTVPVLREGDIAHIRWHERKVRCVRAACIRANPQGEGNDERATYG
jgi:hypothetical protein